MPEPRNMKDGQLIRRYLATNGSPGDTVASALLREIMRRGLDL